MSLIDQWMREHRKVRVFVVNGFQMVGVIDDYDDRAIVLESGNVRKLVMLSSVSTIQPEV